MRETIVIGDNTSLRGWMQRSSLCGWTGRKYARKQQQQQERTRGKDESSTVSCLMICFSSEDFSLVKFCSRDKKRLDGAFSVLIKTVNFQRASFPGNSSTRSMALQKLCLVFTLLANSSAITIYDDLEEVNIKSLLLFNSIAHSLIICI